MSESVTPLILLRVYGNVDYLDVDGEHPRCTINSLPQLVSLLFPFSDVTKHANLAF